MTVVVTSIMSPHFGLIEGPKTLLIDSYEINETVKVGP